MSIKINAVTLSESQLIETQVPSINVNKINEVQSQNIKIVSRTDNENIPGPDAHTNNTLVGGHDEFHFLKSIIIDNELY